MSYYILSCLGQKEFKTPNIDYVSIRWLHKCCKSFSCFNNEPELVEEYRKKAEKLKENSEAYFVGNIMGFDIYKYFEENTKLRS